MNVFGKFEELLRIIFRTSSGNHSVTIEPSSSTAGDRTFSLPEPGQSADTLVSEDAAQELTNKNLEADSTELFDQADSTKRVGLDVSTVPTATTVTLQSPSSSTQLVGTDTADNLQNKTITDPVLDGDASGTLIDTDLSAGPNTDTKLPSALAAQTYADSVSGTVRSNLDDHINAATDAHDSSAITNTPAGGISATTTQGAVDELDSEKLARDGSQAMTGDLDMGANAVTDVGSIELEDGATVDTESGTGIIDIGGTNAQQVDIGRTGQTTRVRGNLQVDGTTTTVNSATLEVADPNITVNDGGNDASSEGAGLTVERTSTDGSLIYRDTSASKFAAGPAGSEADLVSTTGTQTLQNKTHTSPVLNDPEVNGAFSGDAFLDEDDMLSDSATKVASQQSIKAYTDAVQTNLDTHTGASSGVHGVTGDVVGTTDTQTLSGKTLTSPIINTSVSGTAILDEDDLVSDSDTQLATQQSIKAYVDNSVGGASGSGAGEINYIENGLFSANADGWRAHDVTGTPPAQSQCDDGDTVSSAFTITRETDYIIEGDASGKITKAGGVNGVNDVICYDFTIPEGQRRQPQKVRFTFYTTATDKLPFWRVYIGEDSSGGGAATELDTQYMFIGNSYNKAVFETTFVPTDPNVDDYRLILQYQSSDTDAEEFWIDSVVVGPEEATSVPREGIYNAIRGNSSYDSGNWFTYSSGAATPATYAATDYADTIGSANLNNVQSATPLISDHYTKQFTFLGNALGYGFATQINNAGMFLNRLITIEFDYQFSGTATRAGSEYSVLLIGEDDSVIALDTELNPASPDLQHYHATTVLPSTQPYRLLIHVNSATSATDTIRVDNFYVGTGAPGNIAQVPLATEDAPGIKWASYYLVDLDDATLSTADAESDITSSTLTLPAGTYELAWGAAVRTTYASNPNEARWTVRVTDDSNVQVGGASLTTTTYRTQPSPIRWRGSSSCITTVTLASETIIKLRGTLTSTGGGSPTEVRALNGFIKATRIS